MGIAAYPAPPAGRPSWEAPAMEPWTSLAVLVVGIGAMGPVLAAFFDLRGKLQKSPASSRTPAERSDINSARVKLLFAAIVLPIVLVGTSAVWACPSVVSNGVRALPGHFCRRPLGGAFPRS